MCNDTENFTKDSQVVQAQLPSSMQVTDVFATDDEPTAMRSKRFYPLSTQDNY